MGWWRRGGHWPEYVPVAARIAKAKKEVEKLRKKGQAIQPVELSGRKIAASFWGKGWCDHMDSFRDYENRLPRGRAYVRNGSVVHMEIAKGQVSALVAGTSTYKVELVIDLFPSEKWGLIKRKCAGQIASLVDLLKGKLSDGVMQVVASRDKGLFPGPREIKMSCTCPDYASLCKHIAAVIYGIGARLDHSPELLFLLRGVDHTELATEGGVDEIVKKGKGTRKLAGADLSEMFGIELVPTAGDTAGDTAGVTGEPAPKPPKAAAKAPKAASKAPKAASKAPKAAPKATPLKTRTSRAAAPAEPKAKASKASAKTPKAAPKAPAKAPKPLATEKGKTPEKKTVEKPKPLDNGL